MVSVVIPFRPSPGRLKVATWVLRRMRALFPEWETQLVGDGCWDAAKPFNKARAINRGVERAESPVVVIHDADCIVEPDRLRAAATVALTEPWVVPFEVVDRLTEASTEKVVGTVPGLPIRAESLDVTTRQTACYGGGLLVLRREHFYAAGGFDERFEGWGGEDSSFGFALNELVGTYYQMPGSLLHLWHPEADRSAYWNRDGANLALRERYRKAGDPVAMRQLVNEHAAISAR